MAGYSGSPLAKKLGIKDGSSVSFIGEGPLNLEVAPTPGAGAPFDVVLAFVRIEATLAASLTEWSRLITPAGGLWVCWPKKAARRKPEFAGVDMTEDAVRDHALPIGLVDNKVCAVDDDWSGLRLVWRVEHRAGVARRQSSG